MRRKGFWTLGLMATVGQALHADWKITTVVRSGYGESVQAEYFKGALKRVDQSESVVVLDFDRLRQTVWNPNRQEYVVVRMGRGESSQAIGPEIVIDRVTVDTGERRDFFGRVARHLITAETRADSKAKIDAWYVDSELLPREKRGTVVHVLSAGNQRPRIRVNQTGPPPSGLAVWENQVSEYTLSNGLREANERTIEVTELLEAPLPDELFTPPTGYKRVITFSGVVPRSWTDYLRLEWECLQDWMSEIFN